MSNRRKILLADDAVFFLEVEKSFLQREEFEILMVQNGQHAYEMIALHRPDLVLLDLYMPEMNGDECCRKVKNNPELKNIPIVMVTTAGKEKEHEMCREAGCDDIMLKPIQREHFMTTVWKFLKLAERASPRAPVKMQVLYGVEKKFTNYSVNLSTGGLFLETDNPLPQDEKLTLKFQLPDNEQPISCQGRVTWINSPGSPLKPNLPPGMGIQFLDVDLDALHQIRLFLQSRSSE